MPQFTNQNQKPIPFNPTGNNMKKKIKKHTTHRRKLKHHKVRKTQKVSFNLSNNNVNKYHCPELKPKWEMDIESGKPMTGDFKIKKVPFIALKDLFN